MADLLSPQPVPNPQPGLKSRSRRVLLTGSNPGIAVALGGGFSRGFAHLGVLEVLEQEGIPVSAIVGTSIGALLGAAYADGISIQDLCELGSQVRLRDFLRFQNPSEDKQKSNRIGQFVNEWFQARQVEELRIPTSIVTTDVATGTAYVFTRGPLELAVRASCAFPGLFKPVEYEGRLLADGCIVAPVPTAVAARINARCVLGVAVGSREKSALARLRRVLKSTWTRPADIMLEPDVHSIDWNDFSRVDEARAAGAEAMRCALPRLLKLLDRQSPLRDVPPASSQIENGLSA